MKFVEVNIATTGRPVVINSKDITYIHCTNSCGILINANGKEYYYGVKRWDNSALRDAAYQYLLSELGSVPDPPNEIFEKASRSIHRYILFFLNRTKGKGMKTNELMELVCKTYQASEEWFQYEIDDMEEKGIVRNSLGELSEDHEFFSLHGKEQWEWAKENQIIYANETDDSTVSDD